MYLKCSFFIMTHKMNKRELFSKGKHQVFFDFVKVPE